MGGSTWTERQIDGVQMRDRAQKWEKIEMNEVKDREADAERDCRSSVPVRDLSAFNQSRRLIGVGALKKISQLSAFNEVAKPLSGLSLREEVHCVSSVAVRFKRISLYSGALRRC